MVYKTQKTNKKRYIKKRSKRIYGGAESTVSQYNLPPSRPPLPSYFMYDNIEPPSTLDNLKKGLNIGLQLGNNITASGLEYLQKKLLKWCELMGIDPKANVADEFNKIAVKTNEMVEVLKTEKGKKALANLGKIASEFSEEVLAPASTKVVETVIDNSGPIINKSVKAVLDGVSATPFGPIIEIPRFVADVAGIVQDSTSMVADVLDVGKNTLDKAKDSSSKLQDGLSNLQSVINKGNASISSELNNIQDMVNSSGKKIVSDGMNDVNKMSGGSLKKYQKEAIMIGGRVNKSQLEFLSPYNTSNKYLQQLGGTNNTKRNYRVCRKMTSRKR